LPPRSQWLDQVSLYSFVIPTKLLHGLIHMD
jgi:hypothetical protein